MKSKRIALALALSAVLVLTGCQSAGSADKNEGAAAETATYQNGTYRGGFIDGTIVVEFEIKDNKFEAFKYRTLKYKDVDYLDEKAEGIVKDVASQYNEVCEYLVGKDVTAIDDLYKPENIVTDTDTVTGATLRANKVLSAVYDGLNRHAYKLAE